MSLHHAAHPVESTVLVDNLNDSHGSHKEEQCSRSVAKVLLNDGSHLLSHSGYAARVVRVHKVEILQRIEHVERPAHNEHKQRNSGFVHFSQAFGGDACVSQHEGYDDSKS